MGAAEATGLSLAAALVLALAAPARAESSCTGTTAAGGRFATCFDPGNRLVLTAGSGGYGGRILLRHVMRFDDEPDLIWKLEHGLLAAQLGYAGDYEAVVYRGRYLRHARDGHIVLPFSVGNKVFVPFDIGAEAEAGRVESSFGAETLRIGVVRTAALIDLSRSESFRRRLSIGAVLRWDVQAEREPIGVAEHVVAPFSIGIVDAHAESGSGLTIAGLRVEAGRAWSSTAGWYTSLQAELLLERVLLAVNDRPVSVVLAGRYRRRADELRGQIGVRFALFQRLDRRVNLRPLASPSGQP